MAYDRDALGFVKALDDVADRLRKLENGGSKLVAKATNDAAEVALKKGRELIRKDINFDSGYLTRELFIAGKATPKQPVATVRARRRKTTHRRFGAKYLTKPAKSKPSRLKGRRVGDVISPGQKAAGLGGYTVWKSKGQQRWGKGFFINAKGNVLTMHRVGPGKGDIKTLYGPSVAQAWRSTRDDVIKPAIKELKRSIRKELRK